MKFLVVCPFLLMAHVLPGHPKTLLFYSPRQDISEASRYSTAWIVDPAKGDTVGVLSDSTVTVLHHARKWHR